MPSINDLIEEYKKKLGITELDLSEQTDINPKKIVTIYGAKGVGKTTLAFSFPGTIAALSFDKKSLQIKNNMYNMNDRIKVFDCVKYLDEDFDTYTVSSSVCYTHAVKILDSFGPDSYDWIVIDALEVLTQIAEMYMRFRNGITPFQGVSNMNVWKERRLLIRNIHQKALDCARKGVIYTTYTKTEIEESGGQETNVSRPKWLDIIEWETDVVVQIVAQAGQGKMRYVARITSSKDDKWIQTGKVFDITGGKTILPVVSKESKKPASEAWGNLSEEEAEKIMSPSADTVIEAAGGIPTKLNPVPAIPAVPEEPKVKKTRTKKTEVEKTPDVPQTPKEISKPTVTISTGTVTIAGTELKTESQKEVPAKKTDEWADW